MAPSSILHLLQRFEERLPPALMGSQITEQPAWFAAVGSKGAKGYQILLLLCFFSLEALGSLISQERYS